MAVGCVDSRFLCLGFVVEEQGRIRKGEKDIN